MLMPSGMLCNAMAIANDIPSFKLWVVAIKVAIPSGILCKIIASIDITPTLYKLSVVGTSLSIIIEIIIPRTTKIKHINITGISLKFLVNRLLASGIRSVNDIHNITPDAKDKEPVIMEFLFLIFMKIKTVPNKVEKPANKVKIKGINFTIKIYEKKNIKMFFLNTIVLNVL